MLVELTHAERSALMILIHSYREDAARAQEFFDQTVVPPERVTSEQLLLKVSKAFGGRKPERKKK